jgi:hypothetical protein
MSWVKRNLYFLIGGVIAAALLGLAGFYFYSKWSLNRQTLDKLSAAYDEWEKITLMKPSPGNEKTDNIKLAREQRVQVEKLIEKVDRYFEPIPPIPTPVEGGGDFTALFRSSLRRTIDQMQKDAATSGVTLPPRYKFTFEAQSSLFNYAPGTVEPLSGKLGDIKAICNILFRARINSLDNLRRERVGADDLTGPMADYLDTTEVSATNDLAVLVPYEVTFHCFSGELANVLTGFANSPNGFVVKTVNCDSSGAAAMTGMPGMGASPDSPYPGGYRGEGGMMPQPAAAPTPAPGRGGLITILDEKQLRVTLVLDVVKLPAKK